MSFPNSLKPQSGQTLIEVLMVLVVGSIMLTGLSLMVISSLRNAQFAQDQVKATKYAQEAIDQIRAIRDGNQDGSVQMLDGSVTSFGGSGTGNGAWDVQFSSAGACNDGKAIVSTYNNTGRYFTIVSGSDPSGPSTILQEKQCGQEEIDLPDNGFSRQVFITDKPAGSPNGDYTTEKDIVVEVSWTDAAGRHSSNLETILTPLNQ